MERLIADAQRLDQIAGRLCVELACQGVEAPTAAMREAVLRTRDFIASHDVNGDLTRPEQQNTDINAVTAEMVECLWLVRDALVTTGRTCPYRTETLEQADALLAKISPERWAERETEIAKLFASHPTKAPSPVAGDASLAAFYKDLRGVLADCSEFAADIGNMELADRAEAMLSQVVVDEPDRALEAAMLTTAPRETEGERRALERLTRFCSHPGRYDAQQVSAGHDLTYGDLRALLAAPTQHEGKLVEALRGIANAQRLGAQTDIGAWIGLADACQRTARDALASTAGPK